MHMLNALKKNKVPSSVKNIFINTFFNKRIMKKIENFKPNVSIFFENKKYVIKTAQNGDDLRKVLQLRHEVFYEEILHKKKQLMIDVDKFDFKCDHLIIAEKDKFLGTYRLNCSLFTKQFYSVAEFNIKKILSKSDTKLELGRACIHKDFRTNFIIALLWKGLNEYIKTTHSRFIFGCSSIHTMDVDEIVKTYLFIKSLKGQEDDYWVKPKLTYKIKNFATRLKTLKPTFNSNEMKESDLPPLIRFYLKAGAVFCGHPIIDKDFECADFFTLLDMDKVNSALEKRLRV